MPHCLPFTSCTVLGRENPLEEALSSALVLKRFKADHDLLVSPALSSLFVRSSTVRLLGTELWLHLFCHFPFISNWLPSRTGVNELGLTFVFPMQKEYTVRWGFGAILLNSIRVAASILRYGDWMLNRIGSHWKFVDFNDPHTILIAHTRKVHHGRGHILRIEVLSTFVNAPHDSLAVCLPSWHVQCFSPPLWWNWLCK